MIGRLIRGTALAGVAAVAWGAGIERRWYATRQQDLAILGGVIPLKVLFFSDLHLAPGQDHRLAYVREAVRTHQPDLVVSGGDNLEHEDSVDRIVDLHREVLEIAGAPGVAILGAHDRYGPQRGNPASYLRKPSGGPTGRPLDTDRLVTGMEAAGWEVLINRQVRVQTGAGPVQVVGVDDPHILRDDLSVIPEQADPEAILRLGLVHAPYRRALRRFARSGFDLTLAGHTHGGQLAVPFWGALVSNCDLPPAQARGTSMVDGMPLHVSAGLGHSVYYPIRFACRPELSVLDLLPRAL